MAASQIINIALALLTFMQSLFYSKVCIMQCLIIYMLKNIRDEPDLKCFKAYSYSVTAINGTNDVIIWNMAIM